MLRIRKADYYAIRHHGEQTYSWECCGVLLGLRAEDVRLVSTVIPCANARADSPRNRFSIDPRELARVQREARQQNVEIIGFYHSHPDHPARWSATDLEEAHWVGCSYVITSVERGVATSTRSFLLAGTREEDKAFVEEEVVIE